jgi:hypothetical protein
LMWHIKRNFDLHAFYANCEEARSLASIFGGRSPVLSSAKDHSYGRSGWSGVGHESLRSKYS